MDRLIKENLESLLQETSNTKRRVVELSAWPAFSALLNHRSICRNN